MKNPLLDYNFLHALDAKRNRVTYARITSLTLDNLPVERIEGVFTGGSITIDGSSAVRRICNLTMTTKNLNMNNIYWGLTTRVKIEIGLENNLVEYPDYPPIIWFPQGVYIITDFKTSNQVNNYTITLSGKDKMCLLNGDVGGNFNAETDCGTVDWQDSTGEWHLKDKLSISQIIYNLVHEYAQETDDNIIIKDIEKGLEILRNNSKNNIYIIERQDTQKYISIFYKETLNTSSASGTTLAEDTEDDNDKEYKQFSPEQKYKNINFFYSQDMIYHKIETWEDGTTTTRDETISEGEIVNPEDLEHLQNFIFKPTTNEDDIGLITNDPYGISTKVYCYQDGKIVECVILKIGPQEDVGYKMLDLFYPDELIAAPGETVVSIFDKIIKAFGVYEYFYDIEGRFVFQAKETYVNTAWNAIVKRDDETYIDPSQVNKYVQYNFEGSNLTTAYQNSPNMGNIKNDYTVWGKKKNSSDHEIPIHMRYAIDIKPEFYKSFDGKIYLTTKQMYNLFKKEIETAQQPYRKHPLPDTLLKNDSTSWWHIEDWYNCYEDITGDYPLANLSSYQAKNATGFSGRLYFPNTKDPDLIVATESAPAFPEDNVLYIGTKPIFIFDMIGDYPAMGPGDSAFQHRFNSCGHTLQWFLERMKTKNYDSYVYQPYIPEVVSGENIEKAKIINGQNIFIVDWREIIFQMAKDYYAHHLEDDFAIKLRDNNIIKPLNLNLFPKGRTGYEQYYHDIEGFWRSLYLPSYLNLEEDSINRSRIFSTLDAYDITDTDAYYNEDNVMEIINKSNIIQYEDINLTLDELKENYKYNYLYWNKKVFTDPSTLYFWFDFFDAESLGLGQFSVPAIGTRPKVINNDKVKSIIYKGIPNIIFSATDDEYEEAQKNFTGYQHFQMGTDDEGNPGLVTYGREVLIAQSGIDTAAQNKYIEVPENTKFDPNKTYYILDAITKNFIEVTLTTGFQKGITYYTKGQETIVKHQFQLLSRSNRSITAQEEIDDLVYNFSYCNETVTINTVPIYYLEPNTIISAKDEQRVVNGYYIMNKITVPLTYNGTTSITAIKVPERIY